MTSMPGSTDALVRVSMMQKSRTHGCVRTLAGSMARPFVIAGTNMGGVLMKDLFNLQQLVIIVLGALSGPFNSITIPAVSA
jgi:hypothetical protein